MQGIDAGPGTDLGALPSYVAVWVTMMAAMMLPSVAPMALIFARISRERARRGETFVPTWIFLAGYLAAWTRYGLLAYGVFRFVTWLDPVAAGDAACARVCARVRRSWDLGRGRPRERPGLTDPSKAPAMMRRRWTRTGAARGWTMKR